jgi:integrase
VIPASRMKMRREHAVPLTDAHRDILLKVRPMVGAEFPASGPIFPGKDPRRGVSVTGLRKYLITRLDADGRPYVDPAMEDRQITLHGFRSTFRTWGEDQLLPDGSDHLYSEKLLEKCIAHAVGSKTRRRYVRSAEVGVRRQITSAWADYCAVVQTAKAAPLRRWAA